VFPYDLEGRVVVPDIDDDPGSPHWSVSFRALTICVNSMSSGVAINRAIFSSQSSSLTPFAVELSRLKSKASSRWLLTSGLLVWFVAFAAYAVEWLRGSEWIRSWLTPHTASPGKIHVRELLGMEAEVKNMAGDVGWLLPISAIALLVILMVVSGRASSMTREEIREQHKQEKQKAQRSHFWGGPTALVPSLFRELERCRWAPREPDQKVPVQKVPVQEAAQVPATQSLTRFQVHKDTDTQKAHHPQKAHYPEHADFSQWGHAVPEATSPESSCSSASTPSMFSTLSSAECSRLPTPMRMPSSEDRDSMQQLDLNHCLVPGIDVAQFRNDVAHSKATMDDELLEQAQQLLMMGQAHAAREDAHAAMQMFQQCWACGERMHDLRQRRAVEIAVKDAVQQLQSLVRDAQTIAHRDPKPAVQPARSAEGEAYLQFLENVGGFNLVPNGFDDGHH